MCRNALKQMLHWPPGPNHLFKCAGKGSPSSKPRHLANLQPTVPSTSRRVLTISSPQAGRPARKATASSSHTPSSSSSRKSLFLLHLRHPTAPLSPVAALQKAVKDIGTVAKQVTLQQLSIKMIFISGLKASDFSPPREDLAAQSFSGHYCTSCILNTIQRCVLRLLSHRIDIFHNTMT